MKKEKITLLVKEPGRAPEAREIDNTLEAMQRIVGGYIETLTFATDAALVVNEEGKLKDLPYNFQFLGDYIVGTAFFVGIDGDEFTDCPKDFLESQVWKVKEERRMKNDRGTESENKKRAAERADR